MQQMHNNWQPLVKVLLLILMIGLSMTATQCRAYALLAHYNMEDLNRWSGAPKELRDVANYGAVPFNGKAIGAPVPSSAFSQQAKVAYPQSTCAYSVYSGPSTNGGAFLINDIPVDTSTSGKQSVTFWMYWDGDDAVAPLGWSDYKLVIKNNVLGFDANDGRIYGSSASGLANGWHHVAAIFTNLDMSQNSLYIDGELKTLTMSGTRKLNSIAKFDPDSIPTPAPPPGWFTDNPSGVLEVFPSTSYGIVSPTGRLLEIENAVGDYNLYTLITPKKGEELTLSLDYASRPGFTTGNDSAIDVLLDNVFITRLNTQVAQFQHFNIPLGYGTGNTMRLEFRSVDRNSTGGLLTNIDALQNQAVASESTFVIGGFGSQNTMRFRGRLDEVRVYKGAITNSQVQADFNEVHACNRLSYLQIVHPGEGVACIPAAVKINSCIGTDSQGQCMRAALGISGTLNASTLQGALVNSRSFAISPGTASTDVDLSVPVAQTVKLSVSDFSAQPERTQAFECLNTKDNSNSCDYISREAGFVFSTQPDGNSLDIANQLAGQESTQYYLRAIQTDNKSAACQAALTGNTKVQMGYQCINPTTCAPGAGNQMHITGRGQSIISANNEADASLRLVDVDMTFDQNGSAPFTLNYFDVGQTTLRVEKTVNAAKLTGSTTFVTKPYYLGFPDKSIKSSADLVNPAADSTNGPAFVQSGTAFKATVAAYAKNNALTRNFGREQAPESVTLQASLIAPAGGAPGVLNNASTQPGSFSGGKAELATLEWNEVGIITLSPRLSDGDYLGAGDVTAKSSGNVGRFYPHHFGIAAINSQVACKSFTYFGQDDWHTLFEPFALARDGSGTQNYEGDYGNSFAKFNLANYSRYHFSLSPASYTLGASKAMPTGQWVKGKATVMATHLVNRPADPVPEALLTLMAKPLDDDGVSTTAAVAVSSPDAFRFGRLFITPAHGSELLALPIQIEAQYWRQIGLDAAYVRNKADICTQIPLKSIVMKNYHGNLNACETHLSGNANVSGGVSRFKLTAPGIGSDGRPNTGSVDLEVNLGPALSSENTCISATEQPAAGGALPWFGADPVSRASFGIYKSPVIYLREVF